jgi:hypothetical protein
MTNSSSASRTGFLCAATVALTLALAGCHVEKPYEATPSTEAAKALQDLKSLPSFEDTKAQVQAAMAEITAGAQTLVPSITWQTFHEGSFGNCDRPYEQTNGRDYFFPDQVALRAAISEEDWAKILQMAKDSAAKVGATDIQVMKISRETTTSGYPAPREYSSRSAIRATSWSRATPAADCLGESASDRLHQRLPSCR